jgi:hypothetical protein
VLEFVKVILMGAGSGAGSAFVGFLRKREVPSFDWKRFLKTVLIGAVVNGVAGYLGISIPDAQVLLVDLGLFIAITALVDRLVDLVWNRMR